LYGTVRPAVRARNASPFQAGRDGEAAEPIKPFLQYCHDDPNYIQGLSIRDKKK